MSEDKKINRRAFFRFGFRELADRALNMADPIGSIIGELSGLTGELRKKNGAAPSKGVKSSESGSAGNSGRPRHVPLEVILRPPGALGEDAFLDACTLCGQCAKVCPADAILLDPEKRKGSGAPWIDTNSRSCVMCEGLYCMDACPTGALVPTPRYEIDMGTARWAESMCVRSKGEDCTICIDHCPVGEAAIFLDGNQIRVVESACIGCGICQHDCPTDPKAIIVIPKSARA